MLYVIKWAGITWVYAYVKILCYFSTVKGELLWIKSSYMFVGPIRNTYSYFLDDSEFTLRKLSISYIILFSSENTMYYIDQSI